MTERKRPRNNKVANEVFMTPIIIEALEALEHFQQTGLRTKFSDWKEKWGNILDTIPEKGEENGEVF